MKEIKQFLRPKMICRFTVNGNKTFIGEILHVGSSFIVERNPINNRVYFLNISAIQKISIIKDGKNNKEKE